MAFLRRSTPATIGIDLGGSNSFACAYTADFKLLLRDKIATEAKGGYDHVIGRLRDQIERMRQGLKKDGCVLSGIGLAVPGIVHRDGFLSTAPNLGWKDCRPMDSLGLSSDRTVRSVLMNDVNAGLMGELSVLPRPPFCAVAYFCGTGIGGAIAYEGRLFLGAHGSAGEVGHLIVTRGGRRCGCGRRGCLEAYVGKWALNYRVARALNRGVPTKLKSLIKYDLKTEPIKSSTLKKAYEAEDPFTLELLNDYYVKHLAAGISQAVNFTNPDMVILGGGIMEALGTRLLPKLTARLPRHCINQVPELRLSSLGDEAGPRGVVAEVLAGNRKGALALAPRVRGGS